MDDVGLEEWGGVDILAQEHTRRFEVDVVARHVYRELELRAQAQAGGEAREAEEDDMSAFLLRGGEKYKKQRARARAWRARLQELRREKAPRQPREIHESQHRDLTEPHPGLVGLAEQVEAPELREVALRAVRAVSFNPALALDDKVELIKEVVAGLTIPNYTIDANDEAWKAEELALQQAVEEGTGPLVVDAASLRNAVEKPSYTRYKRGGERTT